VELVLEGLVFLIMGLELDKILTDVTSEHAGVGVALLVAMGALLLTIMVRAAYVVPLLFSLRARSKRSAAVKQRVEWLKETRAKYPFPPRPEGRLIPGRGGPIRPNESQLQRFRKRMTRLLADIDYLLQAPLGWREGAVVVWAGMRGAVTVAAAQTLPNETPHRSLLVLIAFGVAVFSLLLQGGTLTPLIRRLKPATVDPAIEREEHVKIMALLDEVTAPSGEDEPRTPKQEALATIAARRTVLLDARDNGTFSAEALEAALNTLDAEQIHLELQGDPQG
jgi:CPA1 family monovalent cation:H+ antiporter